tara:strand:+ start:1902 stop:3011 length:1110 start_codon:yes stop_codon:yes gene_type:complete
MKSVTYIFIRNRKKNYENNNIEAREFYYGLTSIDKNKYKVNVIELHNSNTLFSKVLSIMDKFLNRFLSLPFNMGKLLTFKNLKTLLKTDNLILVTETIGCSAIPFLIILKLFKKVKVSLFVMGLYSKKQRYPIFRFLHNLIIRLLIVLLDNVLFLGKEELNIAKSFHSDNKKLIYFPFCIDTDFWKNKNSYDTKKKKIIFVGNDGNKDYEFVLKLAKELKEIDFLVVSKNVLFNETKIDNLEIIDGEWGSKGLSDSGLREKYLNSSLTIIPLKESFQPSGQSVALQSMSLGIPVMITKTKGFWDLDSFIDNRHLFFVDKNDINEWAKKIRTLLTKEERMANISSEGKKLILEEYNLKVFSNNLNKIING